MGIREHDGDIWLRADQRRSHCRAKPPGLFDFNPAVKVAPSTIFNPSVGTVFTVGRTTVRSELAVENLLNLHYILKSAFTSGPSVGRPRSINLRVTLQQ